MQTKNSSYSGHSEVVTKMRDELRHPTVSPLAAKDNRAHRIQAPFFYLQSSDNQPTFLSA